MAQPGKTLASFSVFAAAGLLVFTACTRTDPVVTRNPTNDAVVSAVPPFQTKEPERYRATRTITTVTAGGETVTTKYRIARDGEMRRDESETAAQRVVYLVLAEGRFVLLPDEKLFANVSREEQTAAADDESESSPDRLLHTEPITTSYQKLGTETIGGRNAQKYRVVVNSSTDANVSVSETLMWVDEALHMPIKSETKSANGTRIIMELSDIKLDVDKRLFQVPDDYERIAFSELRKRLRDSQP